MRRLLAFAAALLLGGAAFSQGYPPPVPPVDTQPTCTKTIVRQQVMRYSAVYANNAYPLVYAAFPPNTWQVIDLKPWGVPSDACWAFLAGILTITNDVSPPMTGNLMVGLRRVGDTETGNCDTTGRYIGQTVASAGTGTRSNMADYVPLVNGEFEACWSYNPNSGMYPTVPSAGVNLHLQAWGEP